MNELIIGQYTFDNIKHIDEFGNEYWYARELMKVLEYQQWRRFENVIDKVKIACKISFVDTNEHFANVGKTSINVNGGKMVLTDYKLSRYACYLITQNADPRKEVVALNQTYFAIQTRRQELLETEAKLKKENINGENNANNAHYEVGKNIRDVIIKNGSTLPEDYPNLNKSIKDIEKINNNYLN